MDIKEAKVESPFNLLSYTVEELNVANNCLSYTEYDKGERKIDVSYRIRDNDDSSLENKVISSLELNITIAITIEDNNCDILLRLVGFFESPRDLGPDTLDKYLRINGCSSLYSIARGILSSITSQVFFLGSITLPLVNFIRFNEIQENESNQ